MRDDLEHGWIVNDRENEPKKAYTCEWCGEPIYYGDDYYDLGGDKICEDCITGCKRTVG